jgi:HPt (histidine-containing phosphotransfer) domain-containing protein
MYIIESIWREYLDNNLDLFNIISSSFINDYKTLEEDLYSYIDNNEIDKIHSILHDLKGIVLNLGMEELSIKVEEALTYIRKNIINKEVLNNLIFVFNESYNELKLLLKQ